MFMFRKLVTLQFPFGTFKTTGASITVRFCRMYGYSSAYLPAVGSPVDIWVVV